MDSPSKKLKTTGQQSPPDYYLKIVSQKRDNTEDKIIAISCQLICKNGKSDLIPLSDCLSQSEERLKVTCDSQAPGDTISIIIVKDDLGPLVAVAFYPDASHTGAWFMSYVMAVYQGGNPELFPAYKWLQRGDELVVTSQTCTTNRQVLSNSQQMAVRKRQTEFYQKRYKWAPAPFGPGLYATQAKSVRDLHLDVRSLIDAFDDYGIDTALKAFPDALKQCFGNHDSFSSFEDYAEILEGLNHPDGFNPDICQGGRWTQDRELGRQMLAGINPTLIAKCSKLPVHFPVTNDMVKDSLNRGLTLEEEMKDGNVYIIKMKQLLKNLPTAEDRVCPVPTGLFYVKPGGDLYPIAIQLEPKGVIFTPSDPYLDWLQAKMYFQCGIWQVHEIVHHGLLTHFVAESICIATKRNLPLAHPIYRLLNGHFVGTILINFVGRSVLFNPGGVVDENSSIGGNGGRGIAELGARGYNDFTLLGLALPRDLADRQVDDTSKLPNYHYRDDGLLIWNAIEKMVERILRFFYKSDADVAADSELNAWLKDLHQNGFPVHTGEKSKEKMPKRINTVDCLIEVCTSIIWVCSARHSAVNIGQYQMYAFSPNAPALLRKPIPEKKFGATMESILDALPTKHQALQQITAVWSLSQNIGLSVLGHHSEVMFVEKEALNALDEFKKELKSVEEKIKQRNGELGVPYEYLLPSYIVNSISI